MPCDHVHTVREIVVKKKKSCYSTVRLDLWQNEATNRLKCPCVPPVWLFCSRGFQNEPHHSFFCGSSMWHLERVQMRSLAFPSATWASPLQCQQSVQLMWLSFAVLQINVLVNRYEGTVIFLDVYIVGYAQMLGVIKKWFYHIVHRAAPTPRFRAFQHCLTFITPRCFWRVSQRQQLTQRVSNWGWNEELSTKCKGTGNEHNRDTLKFEYF